MRIGLDVSSVAQWRIRLARTPAVRTAAFTDEERHWCQNDAHRFAAAWAIKEAMVKLLGTGFDGIGWHGVWSRGGDVAGALEVGLGPDARSAGAAANLSLTLRCAVYDDGERVLALLVAGVGPVAVRSVVVPAGADRRSCHRASRIAVRRAGVLAARQVSGDAALAVHWSTSLDKAPQLLCRDGREASASFTHGDGIACAAVAAPAPDPDERHAREPSPRVIFPYTDDLMTEGQRATESGTR